MYVAVLLTCLWLRITAPHMRFSTHITRAPTQFDAIRGTAGMSSVQGDHGGHAPGLG